MKKQYLIILALTLPVMAFFQNCAEQKFSSTEVSSDSLNNNNSTGGDGSVDVGGVGTVSKTANFSSMSKSTAVDMVWVIDNSASMTQEADQVRRNFAAFAASIQSDVDLRLALITKKDSFDLNTHVALPANAAYGQQVDFLIHSFNAMLVAAISTCSQTPAASDTLCTAAKSNTRYNRAYGSLSNFFRPGVQKVFVFVTDDDSSGASSKQTIQFDDAGSSGYVGISKTLAENEDFISKATFNSRMTAAFANTSVKSFGFIGFASSACKYRESKVYADLISSSQGKGFDICKADWSSSFSELTQSVLEYAKNEYDLNEPKIHKVNSVTLNGQVLVKNTDYTVSGDKITLKASLVSAVGNYNISVAYEVNQ